MRLLPKARRGITPMMARVVWLLAGTFVAVMMATPSGAGPACPAPKTCPAFVLDFQRWPTKGGEPVVIPYYVSTKFDSSHFRGADLPPVVAAASRIWEAANPRLRFRYQGTTDSLPGLTPDGKNVIGFDLPTATPGLEAAHASLYFQADGRLREADLTLDVTRQWVWHRCPQREGGCNGHSRPFLPETGTWGLELQGILLHELGHWLGLGHADEAGGTEMTMFSTEPIQNLKLQTLGLGDVLGVRAAYPCGKCGGRPVVYAP